jgi:hypothetical protein
MYYVPQRECTALQPLVALAISLVDELAAQRERVCA